MGTKRILPLAVVSALLMVMAVSCGPKSNDASDGKEFEDYKMAFTDTLKFDLNLADDTVEGNFRLEVKHTDEYPFDNIWLKVTYGSFDDNGEPIVKSMAYDLNLADSNGEWIGFGTAGQYETESKPRRIKINPAVPLTIRQVGEVDTLNGVIRVGFTFLGDKKVEEQKDSE